MRGAREYYDRFASGYELRRSQGYHALLDELESELVRRHVKGMRVLDAGCGTGLVSTRLADVYPAIIGVDLSRRMLIQAQDRGQRVLQADLGTLPFKDEAFDGLFSFKVLAHVPRLYEALKELKRVVKPGGILILEFYNPVSIRGLKKKFRIKHKVASDADETEVYMAFHTLGRIKKILPRGLKLEAVRGIMIFTPLAVVHRLPLLGALFRFLERKCCDGILKCFGGFLDVVVRKIDH